MARDLFQTTLTRRTSAGLLEPLGDMSVFVYYADSGDTLATPDIYTSRGGSGKPNNPMTTGPDGFVEFWAEAGAYDIRVVDDLGVSRPGGAVAERRFGWNALPAEAGGIPADLLADIDRADLTAALQAMLYDVGDIKPTAVDYVAGVNEPPGWAIADGRAVPRTGIFAALFSRIGTKYGSGDGATTFNLPDYRARVLVGRSYIRAGESGTAMAEVDDLAKHDGLVASARKVKHKHARGTLGISDPGHFHSFSMTDGFGDGQRPPYADPSGVPVALGWATDVKATGISLTGTIGDINGPAEGPAFHVVNYLIKL